jgi:hypothetical protein
MNGNSGVDAGADFRATFFAATFFTAAFLAVAFFAGGASSLDAGLLATLLAARLRAGGVSPAVPAGVCGMVSWSLLLLIRNRLNGMGIEAA